MIKILSGIKYFLSLEYIKPLSSAFLKPNRFTFSRIKQFKPTIFEHSSISKRFFQKNIREHHPMDSSSIEQVVDIDLRSKAHKLCCDHLGGIWKRISVDDINVYPISGGMSNLLYRCSLPSSVESFNGEPSQVLLRLYGDQSLKGDTALQVDIFKMISKKDLGPKLYGDFDEGRLEEFLPADSLTCEELMDRGISTIIARKLATVHGLDVPMPKNGSWLVQKLREWHAAIKAQPKQLVVPQSARETTIDIARRLTTIDFGEEIKFLRTLFEHTNSPIVFSHNDLHQGNILLTLPTKRRQVLEKRVILIDFEYSSYNYRAYDIANHFSEWCFEYDTPEYPHFIFYEDRYPSEEIQRDFVRNYLDQQRRSLSRKSYQNGSTPAILRNGQISNNNYRDTSRANEFANGHIKDENSIETNENVLTTDKEIDEILDEVKIFRMAANLVWSLWSIKSAYASTIEFGYWEHAHTRWRLYSKLKKSYLKTSSPISTIGDDDISKN